MKNAVCVLIGVVILGSGAMFAGGWNNALMGSRAVALGAAFAAIADDASAVYYNPAGLAFLKMKSNLFIGGFYINPEHEYTMPNGEVAHSRYNVGFPQFFFTHRLSDRIVLGIGGYIPYAGGGVDWTSGELGFPFKSTLGVLAISPSLGYRVSEKLSLGFKVNYYRGVLDVHTQGGPFGPLKSEESGTSLAFGLGILYKASERVSFGVNVIGPAKMTLQGKTAIPVEVPGFGLTELKFKSETRFNLPWDFEFGSAVRISDRILVTASAQYTLWSTLDKVNKTIRDIPIIGNIDEIEELNFKNILIFRGGIEYDVPGGIFLRAGLGIDRAASPEETLSITNVDVDKLTLIGGIGYRTGRTSIDFTFVQAHGREREKHFTSFGLPMTERYNLNATILGLGVSFAF